MSTSVPFNYSAAHLSAEMTGPEATRILLSDEPMSQIEVQAAGLVFMRAVSDLGDRNKAIRAQLSAERSRSTALLAAGAPPRPAQPLHPGMTAALSAEVDKELAFQEEMAHWFPEISGGSAEERLKAARDSVLRRQRHE